MSVCEPQPRPGKRCTEGLEHASRTLGTSRICSSPGGGVPRIPSASRLVGEQPLLLAPQLPRQRHQIPQPALDLLIAEFADERERAEPFLRGRLGRLQRPEHPTNLASHTGGLEQVGRRLAEFRLELPERLAGLSEVTQGAVAFERRSVLGADRAEQRGGGVGEAVKRFLRGRASRARAGGSVEQVVRALEALDGLDDLVGAFLGSPVERPTGVLGRGVVRVGYTRPWGRGVVSGTESSDASVADGPPSGGSVNTGGSTSTPGTASAEGRCPRGRSHGRVPREPAH